MSYYEPSENTSEPRARARVPLTLISGLGGKRLELLKEAVPRVARVAVLYESANPGSVLEVKEDLPVAARALGLTVRSWEVELRTVSRGYSLR